MHSIGYGGDSAKANKEALLRQIGAAMKEVAQVRSFRDSPVWLLILLTIESRRPD